MQLKLDKALINNEVYFPITRLVDVRFDPNDFTRAIIADDYNEEKTTIKTVDLPLYFKSIVRPSKEDMIASLDELLCPSVFGTLVPHEEVDEFGAPAWSKVYRLI